MKTQKKQLIGFFQGAAVYQTPRDLVFLVSPGSENPPQALIDFCQKNHVPARIIAPVQQSSGILWGVFTGDKLHWVTYEYSIKVPEKGAAIVEAVCFDPKSTWNLLRNLGTALALPVDKKFLGIQPLGDNANSIYWAYEITRLLLAHKPIHLQGHVLEKIQKKLAALDLSCADALFEAILLPALKASGKSLSEEDILEKLENIRESSKQRAETLRKAAIQTQENTYSIINAMVLSTSSVSATSPIAPVLPVSPQPRPKPSS